MVVHRSPGNISHPLMETVLYFVGPLIYNDGIYGGVFSEGLHAPIF